MQNAHIGEINICPCNKKLCTPTEFTLVHYSSHNVVIKVFKTELKPRISGFGNMRVFN